VGATGKREKDLDFVPDRTKILLFAVTSGLLHRAPYVRFVFAALCFLLSFLYLSLFSFYSIFIFANNDPTLHCGNPNNESFTKTGYTERGGSFELFHTDKFWDTAIK
jgi:hypothetical protein